MANAWRTRRTDRLHAVPPVVTERHTLVRGRSVRSLTALPGGGRAAEAPIPLVVVLPGLGLPGYTLPTARALAARGLECAVLDLPGFGADGARPSRPHIHAIGLAAARWVETEADDRPVVVLGHSTGAQAALTTALALGAARARLAVVLAGPTFVPRQRRLIGLAAATPFAYRDDVPAELIAGEVWRGRAGILSILLSGLRDAPEERITDLAVPLTVTAGARDAYAPVEWLDELASAAHSAPSVRTSVLGGSHNNLFTHPGELARLVTLAVADARGHHL